MIWNETKECMSRDEMSALQSKRLVKATLNKGTPGLFPDTTDSLPGSI